MNPAACQQVIDQVGDGVAASLRAVDCVASTTAHDAFGRLFGTDGALLPALSIMLVLYVAFFGFSLITGRGQLSISALTPRMLWAPDETDKVFDQIADQDFLIHHPFDSFTSVETFLRAAVEDPHVVTIKITLYRIGANSPLVDLLIRAAETGKQVAVLVELNVVPRLKNTPAGPSIGLGVTTSRRPS